MESQNKDKGKLLSLREMLTDGEINKILIPKIQRDYAQGRPDKASLRERFLGSIFDVIDREDGSTLMLDFIFGQKEEKCKTIFYPVDGQQRLTTLFLLHLYVGKRAGADTDFLRKFSYETRDSSKQFCEKLNDLPAEHFEGIARFIEDEWWYTGLWRTDPTITSMMNMLDDIDRHYRKLGYTADEFAGVWQRLENVRFWRLYLSDLETTDEMYIKMNSRGKPLTEFEHFKAMLDEYAHTGGGLSRKIDTDWTYLLWRYRNDRNDLNVDTYTDNGLDRCLRNLLIFYLNIEGCKRGYIDFQNPETDIIALAAKVLGFDKSRYPEADDRRLACLRLRKAVESRQIMRRFERIMDFFCDNAPATGYIHDPMEYFGRYIQVDYDYWPEDSARLVIQDVPKVFIGKREGCDLLRAVCENGILKIEPTIYVEAFFEHAASPADGFRDRLRILRNLVENTELHARTFQSTLLVVDELISNGNMSPDGVSDEFNKTQKKQELFKSSWLQCHQADAPLFKMVENHWLTMGNMNMVMAVDEAGNDVIDTVTLHRLGRLFNSGCDYFRIEMALLTCGDYSPATRINGVKPYGGRNWTLWRDFTKSFNRNTPEVVQLFLHRYSSFGTKDLDGIIAEGCDRTALALFPWTYYLSAYSAINEAPKYKYRYRGGQYRYDKLNANGGGGPEFHWNVYNLAVEGILRARGIACTADCYGGPLELTDTKIKVDIRESVIRFEYPDGYTFDHIIPQNPAGIDVVDRIRYAAGAIRRIHTDSSAIE